MPIAISVRNLSKTYDSYKKQPGLLKSFKSLFQRERLLTEAVKSISFSVEEGELVGFLGPNGAGKTTTLKMLSGILYPSGGEVNVLGWVPWKRQKEYQKQFAIVMGQKNQLWWDLPAMESFLLNKEIYEVPEKEFRQMLDELVELLDIKKLLDIPVRNISLGERMKCELVASLLHRPRVLFLDEPTIGLDVVSQQKIRGFIKQYNQKAKTTILLTSHDMGDIEDLCRRVIIINQGTIIYDGDLRDLMAKYVDDKMLTATFTKDVPRKNIQAFGIIQEENGRRAVLKIPREEIKEKTSEILSRLPVDDITIHDVKIEEVIRKIFEEK